MQKNINQKLIDEETSIKLLVRILESNESNLKLESAYLYHHFPFYVDDEGKSSNADILIISKYHGIIIIQCSGSSERTLKVSDLKQLEEKVDQIFSHIYSKLIKSKNLRDKRTQLVFEVVSALYLPLLGTQQLTLQEAFNENTIILKSDTEVKRLFNEKLLPTPLSDEVIREVLALLEGSKGIIKPKERNIPNNKEDSKGKVLEKIENEIAVFDNDQKRAALFIIDGPQRIRGLAGSGKTIVLTMKAAQIHLQDPDANILYTFYTKNLFFLIKRLITRFYRQFADKDPNWDKIQILHAWGGRSIEGVYYNTCLANNVRPLSLQDVKNKNLYNKHFFDSVCEDLLNKELRQTYDYSLMDEAQDFPISFYKLCRKITKNNRLIWGYDECQNILDIDLQNVNKTFGKDRSGKYFIDFSKSPKDLPQDLVLHKCYRNPRKNLVCAFSLGFGIYNNQIIQMLENNAHWEDLGFKVNKGESREKDQMEIIRPEDNSPLLKNSLLESEDTVILKKFNRIKEECDYIIEKIKDDLKQSLLPEDILIIALDDINARKYFKYFSDQLSRVGIETFNHLTAPFTSRNFSAERCVTLTTVYRAKGNEAGSVYVVGIDALGASKDSIQQRNKLFTAITRSIGWVTITGIGPIASHFEEELAKTLSNYPYIRFTMPDRETLKVYQRDLAKEQETFNQAEKMLSQMSDRLGMSQEEFIKQLTEKQKIKNKNV